jgi:hypothetical protein
MAAIAAMLRVQLAELWTRLTSLQKECGLPIVPNAMQLVYRDDRINLVWGGDVELVVEVNSEEKALTGTSLVETLTSDAHLAIPRRSAVSHFTLIRGGRVSIDGQPVPRPMRPVLAWDLHSVLSYLAASPAELPYPERLVTTFRGYHVRHTIELLGVKRGPQGRRARLSGAVRKAKQMAGDDYRDEISSSTALETGRPEFWIGVSPAVPPWRYLKVWGQPAEFSRHEGQDSLAGHLADRILTDLLHRYDMVVQRRSGEEHIFSETEFTIAQEAEATQWGRDSSDITWGFDSFLGPAESSESAAVVKEIEDKLRNIPGYAAWHMTEVEDKTQAEVAVALNLSQGRVSQLIRQFRAQARDLVGAYLDQSD